MTPLSDDTSFRRFEAGRWRDTTGQVVREATVRLHVNGQELTSLMCTPVDLGPLAVGFLHNEGLIRGIADIRRIVECPSRACVEVWLKDAGFVPPATRTITSGCGGGITFADLMAEASPLRSGLRVSAGQLGRLMWKLQEGQRTRGLHTSALAEGDELLVVTEDVGRHNTIDKLSGRCLVEGIATRDRILLCTGRISSEMLQKAARMEVPVVVSRTSPTSLSLALAEAWQVTVVGYVRRDSLNVYTVTERVQADDDDRQAGETGSSSNRPLTH